MDNLESVWQVGLLALLAGAMIGALAYRLFAPSLSRADKVRSELEAARQELIDYKASVNSHFDKTSELVSDLTQNYVKVYQHLAEGAQTLGGRRDLNNLLEQQPGKVLLTVGDESTLDLADSSPAGVDSGDAFDEPAVNAESGESTAPAAAKAAGASAAASADSSADTEASTAANDSNADEQAADEALEADARGSAADGGEVTAGEPVIDVSRIEQGAAEASEAESELGRLIPESGKSDEIKPTRH